MPFRKTDTAPNTKDAAKLDTIIGKFEALQNTTQNKALKERLAEAKSALLSAHH